MQPYRETSAIPGSSASPIDDNLPEPIDLDRPATPPDDVATWNYLCDQDHYVHHAGDASKVIPFPRPAWSEPDEDVVGLDVPFSAYKSAEAYVRASHSKGEHITNQTVRPAAARVKATMYGSGEQVVNLIVENTAAVDGGKRQWQCLGISLTAAEALDLAEVLQSAAALIRGTR